MSFPDVLLLGNEFIHLIPNGKEGIEGIFLVPEEGWRTIRNVSN
ncbi:MAG: hypothetical protein ACE5R6_10285 [Candidatus Heimdallarchaeota archaeon]